MQCKLLTPVRPHILHILLVVVAFVVYGNSIGNEFTNWDDDSLVVFNQTIRSLSFENIKTIFHFQPGSTYQPLRNLSYAIDYQLAGLDHRWYHFHSILLHALAAVWLFAALRLMIPRIHSPDGGSDVSISNGSSSGVNSSDVNSRVSAQGSWVAFGAALLFVVHPVNCEAVVWLSGRKYVLLSFFCFLSLWMYVKYTLTDSGGRGYLAGSLLAAAGATLSSPFGIIFPVVFVLYDYAREKAVNPLVSIRKNGVAYLVFILPGIFLALILWMALAGPVGGARIDHLGGDPWVTAKTMLRVLFDYGRNFVLPVWLTSRYPDYVPVSVFHYKNLVVLASMAGCAWFIGRGLFKGDKRLLFCCAWFLVLWLPASNIIPISTKMADRYVYTASVGIYLGVAWVLMHFARSAAGVTFRSRTLPWHMVYLAGVLLLALYFSGFTIQRNLVWKNSGTLWADAVKKDSRNYLAHNNLGVHLQYVDKNPAAAISHYQAAIRMNPTVTEPLENLTEALLALADYPRALETLEKWLHLDPDNTKALTFKAKILNSLGTDLLDQGDLDGAQPLFTQALKADPDNVNAMFNQGVVCIRKKRYDCAVLNFRKVIEQQPEDAVAHFLLGTALLDAGEQTRAMGHFEQAIRLDPERMEFQTFYDKIQK